MLLKEEIVVNIHLNRDGKIRASYDGKIYELSLAPRKERVKCECDVVKKKGKRRDHLKIILGEIILSFHAKDN